MYKHILIPTDGSSTAEKGVEEGLKFARWANARVTFFTARPEYRVPGAADFVGGHVEPMDRFEERSMNEAKKLLERFAERAKAAGIEAHTDAALSNHPWKAIVDAAKKHGCDLIVIASHGRHGLAELWYGSETHELLTHSSIPTLVVR